MQIAGCLSRTADNVDLLQLISRLYDVLDAYLDGEYAVRYYRLEKEENQAYERVATKAMQLQEALMALNHFGQTNKKLSQARRQFGFVIGELRTCLEKMEGASRCASLRKRPPANVPD